MCTSTYALSTCILNCCLYWRALLWLYLTLAGWPSSPLLLKYSLARALPPNIMNCICSSLHLSYTGDLYVYIVLYGYVTLLCQSCQSHTHLYTFVYIYIYKNRIKKNRCNDKCTWQRTSEHRDHDEWLSSSYKWRHRRAPNTNLGSWSYNRCIHCSLAWLLSF